MRSMPSIYKLERKHNVFCASMCMRLFIFIFVKEAESFGLSVRFNEMSKEVPCWV